MPRALPPFLDRLQTVCELAQAGAYFDENGCWGMTLALHEALHRAGFPAQIQVQTEGMIRAYVVADGQTVDYRGATPADVFTGGEAYAPRQLVALAQSYGASLEAIDADRRWSRQLIAAAESWVPQPVLAPPTPARRVSRLRR